MAKNRILLVDDEPRLRKMVKDFLKRADYDVVEAENGKQAGHAAGKRSRVAAALQEAEAEAEVEEETEAVEAAPEA